MKKYLIIITMIFFFTDAKSQNKLTLDNIYSSGIYSSKGINSMRWLYGTNVYTVLESNTHCGGKDIVKYNVEQGSKEVLVSASSLIPRDRTSPLVISDYKWSEDNTKLLIFTNTARVWRYNTKGDYWVLDLKDKTLKQLGKGLKPSSLMFAKFSTPADKVAYVYNNNIYTETLSNNQIEQLTYDGSDTVINGTFDWVYEEELNCRDGFMWSTKGDRIIYWQSNTSGTGKFSLINNIDSLYSKVITLPYPKVGTNNSAVKIGVVNLTNKESKWFDIPGDPRNHYLARMDVIPNTNQVLIQQLNRLQNTNKVFVANIETMSLENIVTDKDDAFLDIHDNTMWLDNNKYFTWTSEKDGWLHLYKISKDGKEEKLITNGNFDVIEVSCIDPISGYVYYIASPDNATERYLFRSKLNGRSNPEKITPDGKIGHNSYQISKDGKWAVHTFQNAQTPPVYSIVSLPAHKEIRVLEDNHILKNKIAKLNLNPKEFFKVNIGTLELDAWMIKPVNFDENKKYPVIVYIYGEPAGTTVQNNWSGGELWSQYLAQQGYIVMSIDPKGTKTPRGRVWRKSIYGKIGIVAPQDHAEAMKKIKGMYPFIDAERIGIWGWSGGGQMTLNCMFKYPDIYSTGIAIAFVCDQLLYDTIYQERYMGLPSGNREGYYKGSPVNFAQNLEGKLMIIHGTADDNVHYQSFERLANTLIKFKKPFSMMSYPMRSHSIHEGENTSYHLYKTMEQFWLNNLNPASTK
ncbi:MAG: S9 family peptidase [Bacteroidales bacterium]